MKKLVRAALPAVLFGILKLIVSVLSLAIIILVASKSSSSKLDKALARAEYSSNTQSMGLACGEKKALRDTSVKGVSSDETVATVSSDGIITALVEGECYIAVLDNSFFGLSAFVQDPKVYHIIVSSDTDGSSSFYMDNFGLSDEDVAEIIQDVQDAAWGPSDSTLDNSDSSSSIDEEIEEMKKEMEAADAYIGG